MESFGPNAKDITYFFGPDFDPDAGIEELIGAINSLAPFKRKIAEVYLAEEDLRGMTVGIDPETDAPFDNSAKAQGALLVQVGIVITLQEELRVLREQEGGE